MAGNDDLALARATRLESLPWERAGAPVGKVPRGQGQLADIWRHRELLGLLTRRELKARYKDSSLGFIWSLVKPLTQLLIYAIVVGEFLGAARSINHFAVYLYGGLTIYFLFAEILGGATSSIVNNSGLVKKVYLPREIFPLSAVGSAIFNFAIQFVILLIAAAIFGTLSFGPHLLYGLGAFLLVVLYGTAFGILLSAVNVYLRDIQYLVEIALMLFMWGSPILYLTQFATDRMPEWLATLYINNPITIAVVGFQEAFWQPGSSAEAIPNLAISMPIAGVVGIIILFIAQRVFAKLQGNFAQEL